MGVHLEPRMKPRLFPQTGPSMFINGHRDVKRIVWKSLGWNPTDGVRLNIASGIDYREGWINVDHHAPLRDVQHDLFRFPWPFKSDLASHILLDAYLEHVPPQLTGPDGRVRDGAILTLEECNRILKPGGYLQVSVPWPGHYFDTGCLVHYRRFHPKTLGFLWGEPGQEPTAYETQARMEIVKTKVRRYFGTYRLNTLYHVPKYLGFTLDWLGRKAMIHWLLRKPEEP